MSVCICVLLLGCECKQEKAQKIVKAYLLHRIHDPASYKSISFETLHKCKDTALTDRRGRISTIIFNGAYEIKHTFQAGVWPIGILTKGYIDTNKELFRLDSNLTRVMSGFEPKYDKKGNSTWYLK